MKGILQGATRLKKVTPPPTEEKREENGQGLFSKSLKQDKLSFIFLLNTYSTTSNNNTESAVDKILARRSMVKSDSLNEEKDGEWD